MTRGDDKSSSPFADELVQQQHSMQFACRMKKCVRGSVVTGVWQRRRAAVCDLHARCHADKLGLSIRSLLRAVWLAGMSGAAAVAAAAWLHCVL